MIVNAQQSIEVFVASEKQLDRYVSGLPYFRRDLKVVPPYKVCQLRKDGRRTVRAFKDAARCPLTKGFEVHHVHPLNLGGTNTWENLALVDPDLHKALHRYIDRQLAGSVMTDFKTIAIPTLAGRVWRSPFRPPVWHTHGYR